MCFDCFAQANYGLLGKRGQTDRASCRSREKFVDPRGEEHMGLRTSGKHHDIVVSLLLCVIAGLFYFPLQNGQWAPISDADAYISVARSICLSQGFSFNGQAVRLVPPGWPYVLAGIMQISTSFRALNALQMLFFVGTLCIYFRILRRAMSSTKAVLICLSAGLLSQWFHLTYMLYSEGLFNLIWAWAILTAMQIRENPARHARLTFLLLTLCAVAVCVRWLGLLLLFPVGAALVRGKVKPKLQREWVTWGMTAVVLVCAFVVMRWLVNSNLLVPLTIEEISPEIAGNQVFTASYALRRFPMTKYFAHVANSGSWIAEFLFEPAQLGRSSPWLGPLANLFGWTLIVFFLIGAMTLAGKCEWLLTGTALYCLVLCSRWPNPVPRYLTCIAPLLLWGFWEGVKSCGRFLERRQSSVRLYWRAWSALAIAVVVCNISLYAVEVRMLHADEFYDRYYAGYAKPMINIVDYLKRRDVGDFEVSVTDRVVSVGISRYNSFSKRGLVFLLNRPIVSVPNILGENPFNGELRDWAHAHGITYYVHVPPVVPWRVWHFRSAWLQEMMTALPVTRFNPYFELYEFYQDKTLKIDIPDIQNVEIRRIPETSKVRTFPAPLGGAGGVS